MSIVNQLFSTDNTMYTNCNFRKKTSKVGYFSQITEIFSTEKVTKVHYSYEFL